MNPERNKAVELRFKKSQTGKRVGVPAVEIARFAGGKLSESWCFGDELGLLLQLGVPNLLPG